MSELEYVAGRGPNGAKLMILGECPTQDDSDNGFNFTDRETNLLFKETGIFKDNCWLTTVSKYHIPPNTGKKRIPFTKRAELVGVDILKELENLQVEINTIKPNCILAIGKNSLWALSGKSKITENRGSILFGMGRKFVSTYNPAQLSWQAEDVEFIGYWNRVLMSFDMKRALAQSRFPEYEVPQRRLEICMNSMHLAEFLHRYRDCEDLSVDIEAHGSCLPACIGLAFNKNHGMSVPLWNEDGLSNIPDSDLVQIWILLAEVLASKSIIGQNFNYDRDKIRRLGFIINKLKSDTMLKAHAINPELPKGLAFNTSIYTEEPFYKDEGMYHGTPKDLMIGNARDACVTLEVNQNMDADLDEIGQRSFFENFLMQLPEFYLAIENQGFAVSATFRDELLRKYIEWDERLRYELFKLVGVPINVNSPKQVAQLLYENFKLPFKFGTGEEQITELLNSPRAIKDPNHRRVCELILEDRRVRKSISTYLGALPDYDGRMRTTYFPCLETGRSSTGQQDEPIRPQIKVIDENSKKKDKVMGIAFQTMTKHGDIGADIRGMYIPDSEDEIFLQADSSQAEARVVWLLADDEEALKLVDTVDYHALTATWFFGGKEDDYSKKALGYEHPIRFCGKTLRHAGHLGAGPRRAATEVNTQARKYKINIPPIHETFTKLALGTFHKKQPKIKQVFQNGIVAQLQKNRALIAGKPYGVDCLEAGRRTFYERWGDELFRQAFSYIPQRTVSDNTKAAGLRIRKRLPGIKIVMEAHDALLFSVHRKNIVRLAEIIKEEFERPIDFTYCSLPRRSLIIPCEIEVGPNYADLGKFKPPAPELLEF